MRWRLCEYSFFDIMRSVRRSAMSFKRSLISFVLSISKGGTSFSGVTVNISFRKAGSVLEDQRSQIHMTITRSVTGIWNAESQTQWFHTTLRSDLLEGDKKILRKCDRMRAHVAASKLSQRSSFSLTEGLILSTSSLNVNSNKGTHDWQHTNDSLIFSHRMETMSLRASDAQHSTCSSNSALSECVASDAIRATLLWDKLNSSHFASKKKRCRSRPTCGESFDVSRTRRSDLICIPFSPSCIAEFGSPLKPIFFLFQA